MIKKVKIMYILPQFKKLLILFITEDTGSRKTEVAQKFHLVKIWGNSLP